MFQAGLIRIFPFLRGLPMRAETLRADLIAGVTVVFSGLKLQIIQAMQATSLYGIIGAQNIFGTEAAALASIYQRIHDTSFDAKLCPLKPLDLSGRAQALVAHIVVLK